MLLKKIWVLVFSFTYLVLVDVKDRSFDLKAASKLDWKRNAKHFRNSQRERFSKGISTI